MKAFAKFLAGGVAIAALAIAAPAAAQIFPGYGNSYGSPYGYSPYGYSPYGYGTGSQATVSQCVSAVQARLNGGYGGYGYNAYGYGGGRVLGISRVEPHIGGGFTVRGVATSGYAGYGYSPNRPNLVWRCRTDFRGLVVDVDVDRALPNYGYDYNSMPGNYGYSPYGYQRY